MTKLCVIEVQGGGADFRVYDAPEKLYLGYYTEKEERASVDTAIVWARTAKPGDVYSYGNGMIIAINDDQG